MANTSPSRGPSVEVIEQIISALTVAQIVTVNTLHTEGVINRKHFAHAFARAIDALAPNPRNQLLVAILQIVKGAAMQSSNGEQADTQAWLRKLLDGEPPSGEGEGK
jgi:hypothetical protein